MYLHGSGPSSCWRLTRRTIPYPSSTSTNYDLTFRSDADIVVEPFVVWMRKGISLTPPRRTAGLATLIPGCKKITKRGGCSEQYRAFGGRWVKTAAKVRRHDKRLVSFFFALHIFCSCSIKALIIPTCRDPTATFVKAKQNKDHYHRGRERKKEKERQQGMPPVPQGRREQPRRQRVCGWLPKKNEQPALN